MRYKQLKPFSINQVFKASFETRNKITKIYYERLYRVRTSKRFTRFLCVHGLIPKATPRQHRKKLTEPHKNNDDYGRASESKHTMTRI